MTDYLYLDIETIPTEDPDVISDIYNSITPPKTMSKADTIAQWNADTKPQLVADAVAKTSFSGASGSICCIGWAWNDQPPCSLVRGPSETDLVQGAFQVIAKNRPESNGMSRPTIVGHYVTGFDIRFLWQRAFVLGIVAPWWLPRDPKPWSNEVHDTMTMWAGAKDTISLDNLCRALGIPGKGNITGADVAGMWSRGERQEIGAYCESDIVKTRAVHKKMLHTMGEVL